MARAGDTIENPISGERITFYQTGAETDGQYLTARIDLAPRGCGPPLHVHPEMEEAFRVVSGSLTARVGGKQRTYGPGEEFTVPPGTAHRWWNDTEEPVVIEARVTPGLALDRFLENVFATVQQGHSNSRGVPGLLSVSLVLPRYWDVLYLARPPLPIQKPTMAILGLLARFLRYPSRYPYPYEERRPGSPAG